MSLVGIFTCDSEGEVPKVPIAGMPLKHVAGENAMAIITSTNPDVTPLHRQATPPIIMSRLNSSTSGTLQAGRPHFPPTNSVHTDHGIVRICRSGVHKKILENQPWLHHPSLRDYIRLHIFGINLVLIAVIS